MKTKLFAAILLHSVSTTLLAQSAFEVASPTSTTNGIALGWTNSPPGSAYTVQTRASLTSGVWTDASMRYRWPITSTNWTDAPTGLRAPRFYRVIAQRPPTPKRGHLLASANRDQASTNQIRTVFSWWGFTSVLKTRFPVTNIKFTYETVDPFGLSIPASALLILPQGASNSLPLVSVQRGTELLKSAVQSQLTGENYDEYMIGIAFATLGYATVLPDYIGMGESPGYQAYHHAKTEATSVVDALRAARAVCASREINLNNQLFLFGYSQGGHATMAAHRELEAFHTNEFTVTAVAPCAGSYNADLVVQRVYLLETNYPAPFVFPILLASWLPIYHLGDTLEEILKPPYRTTIPPLMDGIHDFDLIDNAMPKKGLMLDILRPDYEEDFRTNANNSLRQAFSDNNVYDWTPKAPVLLLQCGGDTTVLPEIAENAYQNFTNRGACCVQLVDPGAPAKLEHDACIVPSLRTAIDWFETFRQ